MCSYLWWILLVLKKVRGLLVEDVEGCIFIDCLVGVGILVLGYNYLVVIEVIC